MIEGRSAADALKSSLQSLAEKTINKAEDALLSALFSGVSGGGAGVGGAGGIFHFASGGPVSGPGSGTSDSIPAMLSHGEFVTNALSTRRYRPLLEAINSGRPLRLAQGGFVARAPGSTGSRGGEGAGGRDGGVSIQVVHNAPAAPEVSHSRTRDGHDVFQVMFENALARSVASNGRGFQTLRKRSGFGNVG